MCWMAIASGEENCRCCDGYSTCPNSTAWEDELWEDLVTEEDRAAADAYGDEYSEADAWENERERNGEYYDANNYPW